MPPTSRAWFVDRYGGPERLLLRDRPDPLPGPGEVLVRTAAIGLNFADLFVRSGDYPRAPKPPFIPGMEISGTVEAVGEGVVGVEPGRRVVAVPIFGGHAEKVVAKATHVFPLPEGVDLVEAAAVPVAFLTAWYACARAEVAEGDRVVVTAAAGGVGSALLQVLREKRAKAIALVGSEGKVAACRALGAVDVGTYESADALIERIGGRVDVVADAIGGRVFRKLWRRLGPSGRYVLYGFAAASGASGVAKLTAARELLAMGLFSPYSFVQSSKTLIGFNLSLLPDRTGELQRMAREVFALWKDGRIRPVLGPRFPFERLPDAHRALAGRGTTGKVVIAVG
jgi:NADPH2:quinone reductase